jgi:hypothetical protein
MLAQWMDQKYQVLYATEPHLKVPSFESSAGHFECFKGHHGSQSSRGGSYQST